MANALGVPSPDKAAYMDNVAAVAVDYQRQLLDLLELRPGLSVLELGCGPGADLPAMADAVTTSGRVVGVDMVRNATIGRQLARLARRAGFEVEGVRTAAPVFHDFAQADESFVFTRNTERAIRAGVIERADGERWLADLQNGDFLAAPLVFLLAARKPL